VLSSYLLKEEELNKEGKTAVGGYGCLKDLLAEAP
jgi:hypothetical protein